MTNSLYYVVYKQLQNDTDFTVFKSAAYQGFNFAFVGHVGRYHTPLDSVANASADSIQHQGDNTLAALSALINAPTLQPPISESVFFDGFAHSLIIWPIGFTLPAALLSLALAALAAGLGALPHAIRLARARALTGWTADAAAMLPALVIFAGLFTVLRFMYMALGSLAWPISTRVMNLPRDGTCKDFDRPMRPARRMAI
jgi:hypothetical protein